MTRNELFGMVWKEPLAVLAPKLGMSKPTLLKLCRRHNVPVPGRGHWAKVRAGGDVLVPELPDPDADASVPLPKLDDRATVETQPARLIAQRERLNNDMATEAMDIATVLDAALDKQVRAATMEFIVQTLLMAQEFEQSHRAIVCAWANDGLAALARRH
jgi:hypothetical protein